MLSLALGEVGDRTTEALDAAEESVKLYRELVSADPATYQPELAQALNRLPRGGESSVEETPKRLQQPKRRSRYTGYS